MARQKRSVVGQVTKAMVDEARWAKIEERYARVCGMTLDEINVNKPVVKSETGTQK